MIFWKLFYTFCKIGIFNFGGGYAMIALIQNEVVEKQGWMTSAGYTSVVNAGYDPFWGVVGAFLASFSVILLPFILMLLISSFILKHKEHYVVKSIMSVLKLTVIGLIAASAMLLVSPETFGSYADSPLQFFLSIGLFAAAFFASLKWKTSPILLIVLAGIIGLIVYS